MRDAMVYATELAVGGACLILAVGAWRRRLRAGATVLAVAGAAAVAHALLRLLT